MIDEALAELKLASEIDPLSTVIAANYGGRLFEAGRFTDAIRAEDRALSIQPDLLISLTHKADALLALNRTDEAVALARRFRTDDVNGLFARIRVLAAGGVKDEANGLLATYPTKTRNPQSILLLALGRRDEAMAALDPEGFSVNFVGYVLGGTFYDSIRAEPRFEKFLADLGLTEAHARAQAWRKAHPPEKPEAKK
jgi:tetratricopeptide (TPR) repeat protein